MESQKCMGAHSYSDVANRMHVGRRDFRLYQAVGALGELSDKSDFSLHAWDSFSQEIRDLLLFVC